MRRLVSISLVLLTAICAMAQETASGRLSSFRNSTAPPIKDDLKNLPGKTIKVLLLNDNTLTDALLKEAVEKGWYISPFEFISKEEFAKEKTDTSAYFLIRTGRNAGWKEDSGMDFLSFRKGSADAAEDLGKMDEIITLPLSPTDDNDGKILPYLPSYISIIQKHIEKIIGKTINAYRGMMMYNSIFNSEKFDNAYFREGDFAFDISEDKLSSDSNGKASFADDSEIENLLENPPANTLFSLVLYPSKPTPGSSNAYQMLICPDTGELIYYHKHHITKNKTAGFSKIEYLSILKYFK